MTYKEYCRKNKLRCASSTSRKMYSQFLEVKEASTDVYDFCQTTQNCVPAGTWAISYGTCNSISLEPSYPVAKTCTAPTQKKEKAMYVSDDKHIESSKINYLSDRIENAYYKANDKARKAFGIDDDVPPQTAEDFIKRIQDGKFMLNDETKKKNVYEPSRYIRWRDPSVKEDKEGFETAMTEFGLLQQDARDAVAVLSPAEALAEVKKLDAWIPSKGNS